MKKQWPNIWQDVKSFRAEKGKKLPDWPDWCYIPIAAGCAIISQGNLNNIDCLFDFKFNPAIITAAATWRVTQGVYRFDRDLYDSLINQPIEGNIPCEAFMRLPEWCVYIECFPGTICFFKEPVEGFWSHLEYDVNDGHMELRFVIMLENGHNIPLPVYLGSWTLDEGLKRMLSVSEKLTESFNLGIKLSGIDLLKYIEPIIQLVLYLCADNADMPSRPIHPSSRVRMSGQADVVREVRLWPVGERLGAAIRRYREETQQKSESSENDKVLGTHASPRPHIRRAHYHHFWTGPRDNKKGERKLILRWLPPIPVLMDNSIEGPVVIRRIK